MIPKEKELKLIKLYMYICDLYDSELQYYCQRYSNNFNPLFTDQEILTIYLFVGNQQKYLQVKDIHTFAKGYMLDWFPKLPSYQTFNYRLNRLSESFRIIGQRLLEDFQPIECDNNISIVDSMHVITCSTARDSRVAREITTKGYCSTKKMYYYGLKLHTIAFKRKNTIPFPESFAVTPAEDHDLSLFKQAWGDNISDRMVFGNKIYSDAGYFNEEKSKKQNIRMLTPIRGLRGESTELKHRNKAYNDTFSYAVSKIRQPIESFFNWLNEKTNIQRASKVRSTAGLWVHTMGKNNYSIYKPNILNTDSHNS
jgi:hypothetical protein